MTDINQDAEFSAMHILYGALEPLDDEARSRVVNYVIARLDIGVQRVIKAQSPLSNATEGEADDPSLKEEQSAAPKFGSLAELYDAAGNPHGNGEKALVAGYWLQVCGGNENFDSQSINKELKNLGEGVANITAALEYLKNQKPALAIQLKKSGTSQQARKIFKVTVAGIKAVEAMINHG